MQATQPGRFTSRSAVVRFLARVCLLLFVVAGCATYSARVSGIKRNLAGGDLEAALEEAEETRSGSGVVLYLLEKGLILHYAGRFEESNQVFEQAERLIEDLYTKSLSREIGAFLTSDVIIAYEGEAFERVWINYYRALNYIYLGERDEALVECRKVNLKLRRYSDDKAERQQPGAYPADPFIQYLTGILYEWGGDLNDAYVSYREAEETFERYGETYGVRAPRGLAADLIRTAQAQGFGEDVLRYRRKYPGVEEGAWEEDPERGRLVVLHENGYIPFKVERNINLPILESDSHADEKRLALTLSHRAEGYNVGKSKVDYWLRVALPAFADVEPVISHAAVQVGGRTVETERVEDLGTVARRTFEAEYGTILLRSIVRALAKYGVSEAAERKSKPLGVLTNLIGVATESADTRSWLTLPNDIGLARFELPEGTYRVELTFFDRFGSEVRRAAIDDVEVRAGNLTFLNYRTFD